MATSSSVFGRPFAPTPGWSAQSSVGQALGMPAFAGGLPSNSIMGRQRVAAPAGKTPYRPGRGLSVGEIYRQRERTPNATYADGSAVPAGMPIYYGGWNTRGMDRGGRIGSAAGAMGSGGVPTSMRGRAEKYGYDPNTGEGAWQMPSWAVAEQVRNNGGGLSQSQNYGDMGVPPDRRAFVGGGYVPQSQTPQVQAPKPPAPPPMMQNGGVTSVQPTGTLMPKDVTPAGTFSQNSFTNPVPMNQFGLYDGTDAAYMRRRQLQR